jgi:peptide/nickel transport system ATP-binding protein
MNTKTSERLLDVRDLTVEIDGRNGPAVVVDGIDLYVNKGETLGVVGESGCGKSLTMLSLMRLLPY